MPHMIGPCRWLFGLTTMVSLLGLGGLRAAESKPAPISSDRAANASIEHRLYVVTPGIRNDLQYGGAGILVFDIDHDHKFLRRIATPASDAKKPDNIKGVCASADSGKLYFTTTSKLYCVDLITEKTLWEKSPAGGTDRLSITPDGKTLYVPSFEKENWNVIDAASGETIASVVPKSGAHNTVVTRDGSKMLLGGLKSATLFVADTGSNKIVQQIPMSNMVRPLTVNGAGTRAYVCVNDLLGYEIADLTTGSKSARIEVTGFTKGAVKRHGCPSHGIGLTPDEKEVWLCDGHNQRLHVFDNTVDPPKQITSIALRDDPGWVTFGIDGHLVYASTGEVIDAASKQIVATLSDENGKPVHSEKLLEIDFADGHPVAAGDQFARGNVVAK